MNYSQTLEFLFSQLPMYQRIGAAAYKTDLSNTIEICRVLGNPERTFPSIHVAGTNGKGSVAHMIASVLQEAGYKTGLYTSPHLADFRERIRINGVMIPQKDVISFVEKNIKALGHLKPSFFEYTFGMAVDHFADSQVDVAVIETGMGGRLDSTNVVRSILSVITNIGFDHTRFLGDTLEKIAGEKAGIIKEGVPVIIGESQPETEPVFRAAAMAWKAPVTFADKQYSAGNIQFPGDGISGIVLDITDSDGNMVMDSVRIPFSADYQLKNTITVMAVIEQLRQSFELPEGSVRKGLWEVVRSTGLAGRWHVIARDPLTICDTGHNREGIMQVVAQIRKLKYDRLFFVLGMVDDKETGQILELLPAEAEYYFCKAAIPRGLDAYKLKESASRYGLTGNAYPSVTAAFKKARADAGKDDLVFIGGSTFVVAEVLS